MNERHLTKYTRLGWRRIAGFALVVGAVWGAKEGTASACTLPLASEYLLSPRVGTVDVPTNAKLIAYHKWNEPRFWLKKVGPKSSDAGPSTSTEAAADAGPGDGGLGNVAVDFDCTDRGRYSLCIGTAALEANTRYEWGIYDIQAWSEGPQFFETGDGPRTPAPVPSVTVSVADVDWNAGRGECGAAVPFTMSAEFEASPEPWVLVLDNNAENPVVVESGSTSEEWWTTEFDDCVGVTQLNWAGEAFDPDIQVCPPKRPNDDASPGEPSPSNDTRDAVTGPDTWDLLTGGEDSGDIAAPLNQDASVVPHDDTSEAPSQDTSEGSVPTLSRDRDGSVDGDETAGDSSTDSADCSCRVGANGSPASAAGLGMLVLGLLGRRRRRD